MMHKGFFIPLPHPLHFLGHFVNFGFKCEIQGERGGGGRMVGSSAHQSTCNAILYSLEQVLRAPSRQLLAQVCGKSEWPGLSSRLLSVIRRGTVRPIRRYYGAVEAGDDIEADQCISCETTPLGPQCAGLHR